MEILEQIFTGANFALLGGVLAAVFAGMGSAKAVGHVGKQAAPSAVGY